MSLHIIRVSFDVWRCLAVYLYIGRVVSYWDALESCRFCHGRQIEWWAGNAMYVYVEQSRVAVAVEGFCLFRDRRYVFCCINPLFVYNSDVQKS